MLYQCILDHYRKGISEVSLLNNPINEVIKENVRSIQGVTNSSFYETYIDLSKICPNSIFMGSCSNKSIISCKDNTDSKQQCNSDQILKISADFHC